MISSEQRRVKHRFLWKRNTYILLEIHFSVIPIQNIGNNYLIAFFGLLFLQISNYGINEEENVPGNIGVFGTILILYPVNYCN